MPLEPTNAIYILATLVDETRRLKPPAEINGESSPHLAWMQGYIAALQRVTDAFTKAENPDVDR